MYEQQDKIYSSFGEAINMAYLWGSYMHTLTTENIEVATLGLVNWNSVSGTMSFALADCVYM